MGEEFTLSGAKARFDRMVETGDIAAALLQARRLTVPDDLELWPPGAQNVMIELRVPINAAIAILESCDKAGGDEPVSDEVLASALKKMIDVVDTSGDTRGLKPQNVTGVSQGIPSDFTPCAAEPHKEKNADVEVP